jgi:hypothetical protein
MDYDKVAKRIEKDKAQFVGNEIEGKTLGKPEDISKHLRTPLSAGLHSLFMSYD